MRWPVLLLFSLALIGCSADPSANVVGTWSVDVAASKIPEGKPDETRMAQAALSTVRIEVRPDGTFSLSLMAAMKGTWKYDGKHLYLKPEGGSQARMAAAAPNGEVEIDVDPARQQLRWEIESPFGNAQLVLVRTPENQEPKAKD